LVAAFIVPRATQPDNWSKALEPWATYHTRYLALGCDEKHDSTFFTQCCHPLPANKTQADLSSSCSSGNVVVNDGADDSQGDDCDGDETTQVPSPTSTKANSSTSTKADSPTSTKTDSPSSTKANARIAAAHNTANAAPSAIPNTPVTGGYITYYLQKGVTGACGTVHTDQDFIAAMDSSRYNSGLCGKHVFIEANQRNVTAMIADECPTCVNENSIDLSVAAFQSIGSLDAGIWSANWTMLD